MSPIGCPARRSACPRGRNIGWSARLNRAAGSPSGVRDRCPAGKSSRSKLSTIAAVAAACAATAANSQNATTNSNAANEQKPGTATDPGMSGNGTMMMKGAGTGMGTNGEAGTGMAPSTGTGGSTTGTTPSQ